MSPTSRDRSTRSSKALLRLAAADFEPRGRAELRPRLLAWAKGVGARLAQVGVAPEALADEPAPRSTRSSAAHVVFAREKSPRRSAQLGLSLDGAGVDVFAELSGEALVAGEIVSALEALPEPFTFGLRGDAPDDRLPAQRASAPKIRALLERGARDGAPVWIGMRVTRVLAVRQAATLDAQLADAILALAPVFNVGQKSERLAPAPARGATKLRASGARREMVTEIDPGAPIDKGTRVRVLAGAFAGKTGTVQELDGKGGARVMLGLLATWVAVKDLIAAAEGRGRRPLMTSHRKPLPARD